MALSSGDSRPAATRHLLQNTEYLHQQALSALKFDSGTYMIVDPLIDPGLLTAVLERGVQPIFIDFAPDQLLYDTNLLEDFLSLSTLINEADHLVYRKDEKIIRGLLLTHHDVPTQALDTILFIARRYHLPVLEDFSLTYSDHRTGIHGQVAIAKIQTDQQVAGLLLQREAPISPLALGTSVKKHSFYAPDESQLIHENIEIKGLSEQVADFAGRLTILKENIFLSRGKVAEKLLDAMPKK